MQYLFRRTRTDVHSASAMQKQQERGWIAAGRAAAAVQLGAQLILWVFFYGYDLSAQAVWQAALMLGAPLCLLWAVWRNASADHPAAKWALLPLVLCLMADAVLLITVLGGFITQMVPDDPAWLCVVLPAGVCWLTAFCAQQRGVRYGAALLAVPLAALILFGTVFLRASTRADRLWPILGDGLLSTVQSALSGAGAAWAAALMFLDPPAKKHRGGFGWIAAAWALCVLCALWFGFLRPWSPGDDLAIAEKMMGLARHAHSVILYELSGIMWMLLIPVSLTACASFGGEILRRAAPKLPRWLALLFVPAAAAAVSLVWTEEIFLILGTVLPWRWVLSLLCGLALLLLTRRRA